MQVLKALFKSIKKALFKSIFFSVVGASIQTNLVNNENDVNECETGKK